MNRSRVVHQLRNRPLVVFALAMILGLSVREYPLNGLLIGLGIPILDTKRNWAALLLGLGLGLMRGPAIPKSGIDSTSYVQGVATVVSVPRIASSGTSADIELNGSRLTAFFLGGTDVSYGDVLRVTGLAQPLREGTEAQNLNRLVVGRFKPISLELLTPGPEWIRSALAVRRSFIAFTGKALAPRQAAMVDALCFNVASGLDDETLENLRETGTIHIISASGFHVFVIAIAISYLLGLLRLPYGWRVGALGCMLAFYAAAAGFEPAIVRSVLMSITLALAFHARREPDLLSALALAAVLYLAFIPTGIFELGFQISFIAVAAFGLFGKLDAMHDPNGLIDLVKKAEGGFFTSGLAFLATVPIILFYFDMVSIVAIPANLLIGLAVVATVVLSLATYCLFFVSPQLAILGMSGLVGPLANYIETVVQGMPKITLQGGSFSGYWLLLVYGLLLGVVKERVRPA